MKAQIKKENEILGIGDDEDEFFDSDIEYVEDDF